MSNEERPTIYPTHACFDDAVEYVNALAERGASREEIETYTLVHAIVIAPDGERIAHAWLEHEEEFIQAGIYNSEKVWMRMDQEEFSRAYNVELQLRYSISEAVNLMIEQGPGPWDPRIRVLSDAPADENKIWKVEYDNVRVRS